MEPDTEVESLECIAIICDQDDNEMFRMDVVEAQVRLDLLRQKTDDPDVIINSFRDWLVKRYQLPQPPSYGRTWNIMGTVGTLFSDFKKKHDSIQKSLTITESTLSNLLPSSG